MYKKLIAIVPAAGIGARALTSSSIPKQYRLLNGRPMLRWAVQALLADPRIDQVRVAVARDDAWVAQALDGLPRTVWRGCGGPTRAETVLAALRDAKLEEGDWVLVHDAARPGLPPTILAGLIDACLESGRGALLAQPVNDTVKRDARCGRTHPEVAATIDRSALWLAQTPQMFPGPDLLRALADATASGAAITDEASAMEVAGYKPLLVTGSVRNFKVTWPEDFSLMEKWL